MFQTLFCGSIFPFNPRCYAATPIRGTAALRAGRLRRLLQALRNALHFLWFYYIFLETFANKLNSKLFFTVPYFPLTPAAPQRPRWGIAALRAGRLRRLLQALRNALPFLWFYLILLKTFANKLNSKLFFTVPFPFTPPPLTRRAAHACSCQIPPPEGAACFAGNALSYPPKKSSSMIFSCPQRGRPSLNLVLSLKPTFNIVITLRGARCN